MTTTPKQAIDGFKIVAKSAKTKLAGKTLIMQIVNNQHTYVFGEILNNPGIQACKGEKEYNLLQLFAFGTYMDFKKNPGNFPELKPRTLRKLKKLSIIDLSNKNKSLSYKALMSTLEIGTTRELEDLLIECMNANLISGKLDQKRGFFEVTGAISRDVKLKEIDSIIDRLKAWVNLSEGMMKEVKDLISEGNDEFSKYERVKKLNEEKVEELEKTIRAAKVDDMDMSSDRRRRKHRFQK